MVYSFFVAIIASLAVSNPHICKDCHEKIKGNPHVVEVDHATRTQFNETFRSVQASVISDSTTTTTQPIFNDDYKNK